MQFTTAHNQPSLTVYLEERGMHVTVRDDGTITVRQGGRDVGPDAYDMGGEYYMTLPDATTIAVACSEYSADPGSDEFPATGTASIEVTHRH
jgi:hypothetical protein